MGAEFTRGPDGGLHLTREGGHAHRRIVHAADVTGAEPLHHTPALTVAFSCIGCRFSLRTANA